MNEDQIWEDVKIKIANSKEQSKLTADQIRKNAQVRIDEFYTKVKILKNQNHPREQYLAELEELTKQFSAEKKDDSARNQKENNPELFTGARNRFIVKAELNAHLNNYDDNWDSNTSHADGKYTTDKKNEWLATKQKLETELKNSPN